MKAPLAVVLFATAPLWILSAASDSITLEEARRNHLLLAAPKPDYPYEMRHHRVAGKALFELTFDYESGHLREVHLVKSTGSPMLDGYSIGALKMWKAKPRSIHRLEVPINFSMSRFEQ